MMKFLALMLLTGWAAQAQVTIVNGAEYPLNVYGSAWCFVPARGSVTMNMERGWVLTSRYLVNGEENGPEFNLEIVRGNEVWSCFAHFVDGVCTTSSSGTSECPYTAPSLRDKAYQGGLAGVVVGGALMLFAFVRRAFTLGDRASVD